MTGVCVRPPVILPEPPAPPASVGLIAGSGRLPLLVAQGIHDAGHRVCTIGLRGQCDPALRQLSDSFKPAGALRVATWGQKLHRMGVAHAVMVGGVDKAALMHSTRRMLRNLPDWRTILVWYLRLRRDHRSAELLAAVADELARSGVHLIDSTTYIPELLSTSGVMTSRRPDAAQRADIDFGWPLLAELLRLDVGQAIAVRDRDVIAVEAVEGTDRMIERAGAICKSKGWTALKGARAGHDRRADVPTIGETTIRKLHESGGRCIALAAGDVIILDKPTTLALADRLGVCMVGVTDI